MNVDSNSGFPRLLGDVGGTNARFALQEAPDAGPTQVVTYKGADYPNFEQAILHYLSQVSGPRPVQGAIGIANPIVGDHVKMTNSSWSFSIEGIRQKAGFSRFLVVNDFTALALSLPALEPAHLRRIGGGTADPASAVGLLGPGTGLGVSGLVRVDGRRTVPLGGEGGHVSLAPANAREDAVVAVLRDRFGHASAERALSGSGLVNLYEALCAIDGVAARALEPAGVTADATSGADVRCVEAVDMFFAFLGSCAGNLALTLGARGGIYIGGGIPPRLGDWIDRSAFRERFVAKGRFRDYLDAIPTWLIVADTSPALIGAARALDEL
ncbi:MAG TPA: glucokinase [Burkholderiaceae bacterium]